MYRIWFCEYSGDLDTDNLGSFSYNKLLYEDIKEEELQRYADDLCKEYHCNKAFIILEKYMKLESGTFDSDKKYCLFFEEELEDKE